MTVLQKCGIISTIARDIIHGPPRYGGLNLTKLYTDNGCQKIRLLLGHIRKGDKTSDIIKVALGCAQQEIGISTPILTEPYTTYAPISTPSWIQHIWKFLELVGGTIEYPSAWTPPRPFEHDVNLVEFIASQQPAPHIFNMFNIC